MKFSEDMKSVCFEFRNPKTASAEPRLKFEKTSKDGEFNLIMKVNETSYTDEITIKLGVVTVEEVEEIVSVLKTMSNKASVCQLLQD